MINAKEMRALLSSKQNVAIDEEMRKIELAMANAITKNKASVTLDSLSDLAKIKLKALEYKVNSNMVFDQRQGEYQSGYIISW